MAIVYEVVSLWTTFCDEGVGETPNVGFTDGTTVVPGRVPLPAPAPVPVPVPVPVPGPGAGGLTPEGGCTISWMVLMECETPPPLPVTVNLSVPTGVPFEVVMISVALAVFGSSTLQCFLQVAAATSLPLTLVLDFQAALAPPGRPFTPSVTFFLKPLTRLTLTVKLVDLPAETVLLFVTESLKSGLGLAA